MTEYTADDFKNARFATHPDGKIAARNWDGDHGPWWAQMPAGNYMGRSDYLMALDGWTPVQENPRPLTDTARAEIDAAVHAWRKSSAISHEGRMAEALNAARKAVRVTKES